jgi:threonyl-tRNA synthetase
MITLTFPDGSTREYESGVLPLEVAKDISRSLAKSALAAEVDGCPISLVHPLINDCRFRLLTWEDAEGKAVFWHSSAHVLAQAIKEIWPDAKLDDGPAVETGFYYDIKFPKEIREEDLARIEKKMTEILKRRDRFVRRTMNPAEALEFFKSKNEDFKLDLINLIEERGEEISVYDQGDWSDLCRGPHLLDSKAIKAFKLMSVAGAYLHGNENNEQLQRVRGVSFPKKEMLADYLFMIEEAKKRDHRKLGKELDLFSFNEVGPGFPFWHPKGTILFNSLVDFWRELHAKQGYEEIRTPMILSSELWHRSGHWDNYHDNMYFTQIDEHDFAVKPMNCPGCVTVYAAQPHSYREFPLKYGELGMVHRHEKSGVLQGLFRVRMFTQDDAHIFCTAEQIEAEIVKVIELTDEIYRTFGFEYEMELSTRPEEKYIGSLEIWEKAENALKTALDIRKAKYRVNPGDGAFYGPKIDFHLKDSLGRRHQCATIQLDFSMPERFELDYIAEDGEKHRPVMIHRAIYGSLERFIGILIEHFAGNMPVWLSPFQVAVLPLTDEQIPNAESVNHLLLAAGIRSSIEKRSEKIGYKIRQAEMAKIPFMLILGKQEVEQQVVAVRRHGLGDQGKMTITEFIDIVQAKIEMRDIN